MGKGEYLGEFEQIVLLILAAFSEPASGREVYDHLVRTTGRQPSVPAVYITLSRLQDKNLVESGRIRPDPASKSIKTFAITAAGAAALNRSREQLDQLWRGARHPDVVKGRG